MCLGKSEDLRSRNVVSEERFEKQSSKYSFHNRQTIFIDGKQ